MLLNTHFLTLLNRFARNYSNIFVILIVWFFYNQDCMAAQSTACTTSDIHVIKLGNTAIQVQCDMDTDNGGWTVSINISQIFAWKMLPKIDYHVMCVCENLIMCVKTCDLYAIPCDIKYVHTSHVLTHTPTWGFWTHITRYCTNISCFCTQIHMFLQTHHKILHTQHKVFAQRSQDYYNVLHAKPNYILLSKLTAK